MTSHKGIFAKIPKCDRSWQLLRLIKGAFSQKLDLRADVISNLQTERDVILFRKIRLAWDFHRL